MFTTKWYASAFIRTWLIQRALYCLVEGLGYNQNNNLYVKQKVDYVPILHDVGLAFQP